jgi:hypothetical protein
MGGSGGGTPDTRRGKVNWKNRNKVAAQLPPWFFRGTAAGPKTGKKGLAKAFSNKKTPFG